VQVIQRQNEAFLRIATTVAQLHRDVEEMRREYLSLDHVRGLPNPFDQADALERKRAAEKERKLRESVMREEDKSVIAGVGAAAAAATATASATAAAPPGAIFPGLGFGASAPAPGAAQPASSMFGGFTPAPAAAPAPAAPGAGMFGAAPAGFGGFGSAAPATTTGFGAAAGGGMFGIGLGASQNVNALDLAGKGGGKPGKSKK